MASTADEPPQAERLETVADATVAGPGATDKAVAGDPFSEKPASKPSSESSNEIAKQNGTEKAFAKPETPQRSAGKVALIMISLCVSTSICLRSGSVANTTLACRLSRCPRYRQQSSLLYPVL